MFILERAYRRIMYLIAHKLMRDVMSQVWKDAYTLGFEEGVEEGTDSIVNQWDDFASGYSLGYRDALGSTLHPLLCEEYLAKQNMEKDRQ
ncbi:hypothetical protein U6B65_06160 [Oscillospiraceae bacterium MB08-C2-2]|nr:hypothetical protein U6B65_06160 [Oscillospiraceae bacterium MB08-C2-2]